MATRSGKANTIQPEIGVASPTVRLFRNAGLASVWNWGDDADSGQTGTPVVSDIDCMFVVVAEASLLVDSALAVTGTRIVATDTYLVLTATVGVSIDQRLAIYEVTTFARECDLQAIAIHAADTLFDERVGVSNSLTRIFDVGAEVTSVLAERTDLLLVTCARRRVDADLLISVPNPTLLSSDTLVAVSGAVSAWGDQIITVCGSVEPLADCLQSVWGNLERQADVGLVVGERISCELDQAWRVYSIAAINCDMATAVACLVALRADVEMRIGGRLTPDVDLMQRIYGLLIAESHIIQV